MALVAALIATISGTALAHFTTTGTDNASAGVSQLFAPTITAATPAAGGTVVLTWSKVTAPDTGTVTYTVSRDGGSAGGTCTPTLSTTTCTDSGLAVGTYSYVVTAKWRTWSMSSAVKTAQVTIGPVHHFVLTAVSSTPAAGASDNLTITAKDVGGGTVTTYAGAHDLTFSGASAGPDGTVPTVSDSTGAEIAFGSATSISFTAGVATVSSSTNGAMKLYKSGSTSIKVGDGSISTEPSLAVTVAPAAAAKFVLTAATTTLAAGETTNLTTTAQDAYGNVATAYAGSKNLTFSGASASPNATAPTVSNSSGTATSFGTATAITFTSGVATISSTKNGVMKLYRAEVASISVSDGSISSAAPMAVTVSPTTATRWALTNINISAGALGSTCLFTCTLTGIGNSGTVKAKVAVTDAYGNTVSAVGTGHAAKITTNGSGTISGTPLAIPATGAAETATTFTYTSKSSGTFTEIVTAAASEGTAYTSATLTATK